MSTIADFFRELQRRNVIRAAVLHVVAFWLLVQVADVVLPYIGVVDEPVRWAVVAAVALFPVTLVIAWFFEHPWQHLTRGRLAIDVALLIVIGALATSWVLRNVPQVVHTKTSIVVLPFEHSGDGLEQGLSRALAYEVNSLLTRSRSIDVIGFESATSAALAGLDERAVADRLDVQHVLAGSITADGDTLRIDLRLIDRAGKAVWNSMIEDSLDNLFAIQENIAASIESRLGASEDAIPVAQVAAERCWMPNDPAALESYYTARYLTELRTDTDAARQGLQEAIRIYRELIGDYAAFAEAYTGLGWAYGYQTAYDPDNAIADWEAEATRLAEIALQHCPTLTEAIHLVPNQYHHNNGWLNSYRQLTAFVELEPHRSENYQRLVRTFRYTGLVDQALEIAERGYALNPLSVRSIKELAGVYHYLGRAEEASAMYEAARQLGSESPNFAADMDGLSQCEDDDIECFFANLPPGIDQFAQAFRPIYTPPENEEQARAAVEAAMQLLEQVPFLVNWFNGSSCEFEHLTPLFFEVWDFAQQRDAFWFWPNMWGAECSDVHADPRFETLVEEAGLVEFWREAGWPPACRPDGDSFSCG